MSPRSGFCGCDHDGGRTAGTAVRFAAIAALLALAGALSPAPADAGTICSVLSHRPCLPYVPSALSHRPFTPYSCGVLDGPCSPQVLLIEGEDPVLRITGHDGPAQPPDRDHRLDALKDVAQALSQCLELPPGGAALAGMQVSVRLAFKRDGALMPAQRFIYTTRGVSDSVKDAYHTAVMDMLTRCAPLPVSDGLGGAIAGRPLIVALTDVRGVPPGERHGDAAPPEPPATGPAATTTARAPVPAEGEPRVLRITGHDGAPQPLDRSRRLDAIEDVARALSQCLELPPAASAVAGMEVEVRLAFDRTGGLMPAQRFTYVTYGASKTVKTAYHTAVTDMLKRCTPLPVSDGLGGVIAGRPLTLALRDDRAGGAGRRGDAAPP